MATGCVFTSRTVNNPWDISITNLPTFGLIHEQVPHIIMIKVYYYSLVTFHLWDVVKRLIFERANVKKCINVVHTIKMESKKRISENQYT